MHWVEVQSAVARKNHRQCGLLITALSALVVCTPGCRESPAEAISGPAVAATPPATVNPTKLTWRSAIEQPGQIEAFEETPIYANIPGYVSKVLVDMNARVKKGAVLAKMAVPEMDEDLKQRKALVIQAKAELELARKGLLTEQASLVTAKALVEEARAKHKRTLAGLERWASESKRIGELVGRKLIDEQTRDEVSNQYKSAQAESEEAKAKVDAVLAGAAEIEARINKAQAEVQAAEARYKVAQVNEDRMAAMLQYATLTAPFDGVVTVRNVHPGHLLKPASNGKDEPLFVVVSTAKVRIFVDVPETEAAYVRPGTPARVRLHALKDREIDASVIRISWALNPKNRTLRAEIELPNTEDGVLRPGMYAFATLLVDHTIWAVPASAIEHKDDGCFCYQITTNGPATLLPVRIGTRHGDMVEVLKKNQPATEPDGHDSWVDLTGKEPIVRDYTLALNHRE